MRIFVALTIGVGVLSAGAGKTQGQEHCVRFEDPAPGTAYGVGDTLTDSGVPIRLVPFQFSDGTWFSGGTASIENSIVSGGTGRELRLNNISMLLVPRECIRDLSLLFGHQGGNMNLRVNGELRNFAGPGEIDGAVIGGVQIDVVPITATQGRLTATGVIRSFAIGGQEFAVDDLCFERCEREPCVEFESLPPDGKYAVGDGFDDAGVSMMIGPFQFDDGTWTEEGAAFVSDAGEAGGKGRELELSNVNLQFQFAGCLQGLTLLYAHRGGNLNLSVNGEFLNFQQMTELHGTIIGGVAVTVTESTGPGRGMLALSGRIDTFAIGGQELTVDRICPESCSEQLCMEFEDPPPDGIYPVGHSFVDTGVSVVVRPFQWESGEWTDKGAAIVDHGTLAGGWAQDINANNVNLWFEFGRCVGGLTLLFGEYGGNVNLTVNGELRNVGDLAELNGAVVGGVAVSVTNGYGDDRGRLMLVGRIDSFAIGGQEFWIDHLCPVFCPSQECLEFEDPPLGAQYAVGDTFGDRGVPLTVRPFQWEDGTWTGGGRARIDGNGRAGGSGQDVQLDNVNLSFGFPGCLAGLTLLFGEYGGNLNLMVNGELLNFRDFAEIDGAVVGGVDVSVVNGYGDDRGRLRLRGRIDSFAVGGQELWIDRVCTRPCSDVECIEFEDPPRGAVYSYRDTFVDSGVLFAVDEFEWLNGKVTTGGVARVGSDGMAGGWGQEINLNNVRLVVLEGMVWPEGLTFLFGEYGGNVNLIVNGDFANFENFADVDGAVIGGAEISVINGFGDDRGRVTIMGPVETFAVGGQELYIDRICSWNRMIEIPPRIVSIQRRSDRLLELKFEHATSDPLVYDLQRSPNAGEGGPWGDDPDGVIAPVGDSTYNAATLEPAGPSRIYRVRGTP